jgi:hypothetical protein
MGAAELDNIVTVAQPLDFASTTTTLSSSSFGYSSIIPSQERNPRTTHQN